MVTEDRLIFAQTKDFITTFKSFFTFFFNQCIQLVRLDKLVIEFEAHHASVTQNSGTEMTLSAWFYENVRIMNRLLRQILIFERWPWLCFNFTTSDSSTDGLWLISYESKQSFAYIRKYFKNRFLAKNYLILVLNQKKINFRCKMGV